MSERFSPGFDSPAGAIPARQGNKRNERNMEPSTRDGTNTFEDPTGFPCELDSDGKVSCEKLTDTILTMQRDWTRLNQFLIATADNFGWCGSFEERLSDYNRQFTLLKLEGRSGRVMHDQGSFDPYQIGETLLARAMALAEVKWLVSATPPPANAARRRPR